MQLHWVIILTSYSSSIVQGDKIYLPFQELLYKITWLVLDCVIKLDFALTSVYKRIDNSFHVYMFPWYQTGRNKRCEYNNKDI